MKKIFLLTTVITIFNLTTSAQIKKGSILLGGQISYYNSKIDWNTAQPDQKYKSGTFNISAGTAFKENSVLGLYITYGHYNNDNNYNGIAYNNSKGDRYNFGVFYRKYKKLAKDFYLFGELGAGYAGSNQTDTELPGNNKTKYTRSGGELYLTPGISYRIYKKLQVELLIPQIAGVQYAVQKTTSLANNSKEDQFNFNTNLNSSLLGNLGLGFRFVL
jgi:hypothetical protein